MVVLLRSREDMCKAVLCCRLRFEVSEITDGDKVVAEWIGKTEKAVADPQKKASNRRIPKFLIFRIRGSLV